MEDVRLIGTALATLLRSLALRDGVLVAIDDAHWLDSPSARALAFGLRRVARAHVGILLTRRTDPMDHGHTGLALAPTADIVTIRLGPLSVDSIRQIVDERLSFAMTKVQAKRLHELSRGNALLALELARFVVEASDEDDLWLGLTGHADVAQLTRDRLQALTPSARRVVAVVAALADPRVELIEAFAGSRRSAEIGIRTASAAGIIRRDGQRLGFEHPLLATAAYGMLTRPERRRLHGRLATVLTDPEERARHLALAYESPDETIAAAISSGARRASARGAQDAAAELAEASLRFTPVAGPVPRHARAIEAAVHLARAGELRRARELCQPFVDRVEAGPDRASLLRLIGEVQLQEGAFPEGIDTLKRAVDEASGDPMLRLPVDLQLTYALINHLEPRDAVPHARRAVSDAEQAGNPPLLATAVATQLIANFFVGNGFDLRAADRAVAMDDSQSGMPALFRPSLICGMVLTATGQTERANSLLRSVASDSRVLGDEASLVPALFYVSWNALLRGDIHGASDAADEARMIARMLGDAGSLVPGLTAASRVAGLRGQDEDATRDALEAIELCRGSGWTAGAIWPALVLASLAWSRGDAPGTVAALEEPLRAHDTGGFVDEVMPFRGDFLEAQLALGKRDEVDAALRALEQPSYPRAGHLVDAIASRVRAIWLSSAARHHDAAETISRSVVSLGRMDPFPYELARTLLAKGLVERRAKRRAAARVSFETALAAFERLGARPWADRTREEIRRLGGTSPNELTATESQVARLAARGLTNRQVSELAFVTPKSVEGILDRVYRKLGIRSRAELGAWAASVRDEAERG
ncbi:MAG: hypothetical protein HY262_06925 [Chloroflexi bacterium]|nr:hypothetical protein [Chloroflexota bacterium]